MKTLEGIKVPRGKVGIPSPISPSISILGGIPSPINPETEAYMKSRSRAKKQIFNKPPKFGARKKIHKVFKKHLDVTGKSKKSVYK